MYRLIMFIGALFIASTTYAQNPSGVDSLFSGADTLYYSQDGLSLVSSVDTTQIYNLGEISVGGEARQLATATVQNIALAGIEQQDAVSMADVVRLVPAAHVQTNSRGETLLYLRNAGERQVALFFDGALLNVPWDNRVDLSLIPMQAVGSMTVAKGGASVLYGANVLGGAVNLVPRSLEQPGQFTEAVAQVGVHGRQQGLFSHVGHRGKMRYLGAMGYSDQDAIALPGEANLLFNQIGSSQRTNTDARLFNVLIRGAYALRSQVQMAVSLLHIEGAKGIAPEGHKNPDVSSVRFWRYPDWRNTMLILNSRFQWGETYKTTVRGSVWGGRFAQTIEQYGSVAYETLKDLQEDTDHTFGTRWTLHRPIGRGNLRMAVNALTSEHQQVDTRIVSRDRLDLTYRQHLYSLGAEYQHTLTDRLRWIAGLTADGIATPNTGDKPARDPQFDYSFITGGHYLAGDHTEIRMSVARKTRFPTLRELFGEALGRFKLNPDLKPESSLLTEIGVVVQGTAFSGEVIGFAQRTTDTIDQQNILEDGNQLRQRINLVGSRVWGVEMIGVARPVRSLKLEGHLTLSHVRAYEKATDSYAGYVSEKPAVLGRAMLVYHFPYAFTGRAEVVYTGKAFSLNEEDVFKVLDPATVVNLRLGYNWLSPASTFALESFIRLNNFTDAVQTPQLGLPAAGRHLQGGVKVSF